MIERLNMVEDVEVREYPTRKKECGGWDLKTNRHHLPNIID